ncbi:MAG: hypothetical protein QOJ54_1992 [Aliidongia sp.]|jgi:hypothetical protein|nr:hypothetical protein [Aliidongia sp.]
MRYRFLIAVIAFLLGCAGTGNAAALVGDTQVPFSAARSVVTGGKTYDGRVYAAPGKQRHEQVVNGLPLVAILRADRQVAWLLVPGLHVYAEFAFPKAVTDYDGVGALGPPLGTDIVAGLKSARYRVEREGADGSAVDGWVWMTHDGIITKLDGVYTSTKNKPVKATFELSDVKLGPQDTALFEISKDVKKLPIETVQGLLSLQMPKH